MKRPLRLTCISFFALHLSAFGQNVEKKPDPAALAHAGRASVSRLRNDPASWTATTTTPGGLQFVVEIVATPTMRHSVLALQVKGQRDVLVRVTQKDRTWYVQEGPKRGKYRPFEAPFDLPSAYLFLMRSEPQFITEGSLAGLGKYEGTSNGISTFRTPLPDAQKKQLASGIAEFDRFRKENQGKVVEPEVIQSVDAAREVLSKGLSTSVELQSGMLTEFGAAEMRTKVSGFRWRSEIDPKEFATGGAAWTDYTDDPTASDLGDLLMIAHCGVWRPGMASPDSDGRLLNVTTGRYRRIPFQGAMTLPGCFTRDRTRVVVSGVDTANGVMGLYEIDLKSGKNRQLGGDLLATGFALFPSLSPDGKTVVVLHKDASGRVLEVQICLVDLATGTATPLGKPRDTGPVSWFPDGAALLINENKTVDVSKPSIGTICRMDMEGRITKLREGVSPVVLGDGKRILFEEQATRTWKTCDLSGGDEQVYASGMKGCAVPAPAPDGKRLLMMRFRSAQAPEPVVFPIGRSDGTPATTVPGLWKTPAWR